MNLKLYFLSTILALISSIDYVLAQPQPDIVSCSLNDALTSFVEIHRLTLTSNIGSKNHQQHSSLMIKEGVNRRTIVDSLKIDLSITTRRDATSLQFFTKLSSQDSVMYKFPADTILGRVRMFNISVNQRASLGRYQSSLIQEIRLEFKSKGRILYTEHEKYFRPVQSITIWNGKGINRPNVIAEVDQIIMSLTTKTYGEVRNSQYIVNFESKKSIK